MIDSIRDPLAVIDSLFAPHATATLTAGAKLPSEWGEKAHFVQALGLQDEENFCKVPCLNDVAMAETVPPFSLVRYRCLVQDVFDPEVYSAVFQESDAASDATSRLLTTKYRECTPNPLPGKVIKDLGRDGMSQRGAYYCVPLPGETAWARSAAAAGGLTPRGGNRPPTHSSVKRSRPDEDVDMSENVPAPPSAGPDTDARLLRKPRGNTDMVSAGADASAIGSDQFGLNFPLPWEERRGFGSSTACIVKLYDDDAESLKVCESIEILGVLCIDPELANLGQEQEPFFADARNPSSALIPRLHAIVVRKLPFYNPLFPFTPQWLSEARLASAFQRRLASPGALAAARGAALNVLTMGLGGDALAAEYALILLASRVFSRHGDMGLGRFSLNLARWPDSIQVSTLLEAVSELVPRAVHLPVTADTLNAGRWKPSKNYDANRLVSGKLQLASGTLLLLDETQMSVGQLGPEGVKAFAAVEALVSEQALLCDYFSYDVRLPLEVSCLLVSKGASIVKDPDLTVPLRHQSSSGNGVGVSQSSLDVARFLLGIISRQTQPLRIPDEVATAFSEDFSKVRQAYQVCNQLGHVWMSLARAQCLTFGEAELTVDRWRSVFELEKQRLIRCKEEGWVNR